MAYTTIDKPSDYFNTVLYTGNDADDRNITGVGFNPDWVWLKSRGGRGHQLYDVVRGANKGLATESNNAEDSDANIMQSFITDGFQVGSSAESNSDGANYVSWNWLASNTTASNSNGDITSTVSANTTAGFSIVTYTGTGSAGTIGHGLNATPGMIICKNRSSSVVWVVYHHKNTSAPETEYLTLNSSDATTDHIVFNDTAPTSSVFSVAGDSANNESSSNHVAYCFAEKKGYSKFGSYTGNGNADGTFVYTGFKPAWVMIKDTTTGGTGHGWIIFDNKRNTFNPTQALLLADASDSEYTITDPIDFLSNGFKIRDTNQSRNDSGSTYIYMAFAESPFVNSNGVPNNAI
jgi:hypothetical protein